MRTSAALLLVALALAWTPAESASRAALAPETRLPGADLATGDEQPVVKEHPLSWEPMRREYIAKPTDEAHTFVFTVVNRGAQPVVIHEIDPSCTCTQVEMPPCPWTLQPNERGTIRATMSFGAKRGTFQKFLFVESNPGLQRLELSVTAR